jgi:hypothetical protein
MSCFDIWTQTSNLVQWKSDCFLCWVVQLNRQQTLSEVVKNPWYQSISSRSLVSELVLTTMGLVQLLLVGLGCLAFSASAGRSVLNPNGKKVEWSNCRRLFSGAIVEPWRDASKNASGLFLKEALHLRLRHDFASCFFKGAVLIYYKL